MRLAGSWPAGAGAAAWRTPVPGACAPDGPLPAGPSWPEIRRACSAARPAGPAEGAAQGAERDRARQGGLQEPAARGGLADLVPVVQVNNRIRTGRASSDRTTIAKPIRMVRTPVPVPIMVNAVAYTAAAAGL